MTDSPATGTVTFTADADGKYTIDSALTFVGAQLFETGTDQYLTLTIGAAGSIAGSVTVEEAYNIYVDLVNDGSITADLPGQTLAIEPFKFANAGSITAEDAATLLIAPALTDIYSPATNQYQEIIQPWSNSGTITGVEATLQLDGPFTNSGTITATGGELDLGNSQYYDVTESWRNAGTISTSLTAVVIYGAVTTAGFGNFTRDGGSIRLSGTIDNSGAVIDLSQGLFEGLAIDGTITGGTLVSGPDGEISGSSGTLDNVTVVGGLALGTGGSLTFEGLDIIALPGSPTGLGALTAVGGTLTLYGNSELTTDAGVTALPSGETTVVAASEVDLYGGQLDLRAPYSPGVGTTPSTLTIGQGMVVAGVGEIGVLYGSTGLTLENRGTIESGLPGGLLTIEPVTLVNDGDLVAENGATLVIGTSYPTSTPGVITLAADGTVSAKTGGTIELSGTFSNAGTITATDATLDLGGGTKVWSNTGTITATDSTVEISGDVTTAAVATIERSGGTIELVGGTLDNSGATINTNSGAFRGLVLDGGTISGGTLITGPGGILATADDGTVTLSGVTVVGGLDLTSADGLYGGFVTLTGGTEIEDALGDPAPIVVNYATYIDLQSFGVLNSDVTLNNSEIYDRGGAFTIAAGVTVSGSGGIYGQSPTSSMINLGTIDVTGGDLTIANFGGFSSGGAATKPIVNDGTIDIAAGATLSLDQSIAAGSGPGAIDIGAGATLDLEGVIPASADQTITFTGAGGQLVLGASYEAANGTGLGATISGFGIGDAIEIFSTAAATSISYVGGTLTLGGGLSDTFTLSGDYTDDSFALTTTAPTYTGEETATIVTVSPKPPTADAWNDGSGDWQSSGAWSTGTPTGGTDAVIGASGSYTVTVAAGETEAVDNLTLDAANATLQIATGGTLDVAGTLKVEAGTLAIAGTIAGGSLAVPGGSIDFDNGTLADATLASAVTIAGTANLLDDTFTAPVTAGASSIVNLEASGTVSFSGTVTLAFGTLTATDIAGASPTTLRLNSDARVTGSGSIGAEDFSAAVPEPVELDNFGTISGPDLTIDAAKFFNFGSLSTSASGYLAVATDNWTNSPDATISETDGSLYLDGSWINDGSITADGGSLVLGSPTAYSPPGSGSQTQWFNENGGTITATGAAITLYGDESLADIEGIQRSGGSITLGGTLDATGQTVNLTSGVLAGLELADGTILGGTIVTGASTSPLIGTFGTSAYGTLAGDTVEGALIVIGGPLTLTDGTGIVNTDTIGSGAGVVTLAGGSLDDVTADLDDSVEMVGYTYSNTLTLTNLTATTASGAVVTQPSDIDLGIVVEGGGTITGGRVINYGTIDANGVDSANSAVTLAISSAGFTNSGALVAEHGDTLEVEYQQSPGETGAVVTALATGSPPSGAEKPWINTAGGTITGVLSTIKLGGDFTNFGTITTVGGSLYLGDGGSQWTNLGTITTTDTAVYLGGDVPLDLGDINETGGELYLTGTLDNTGNTIDTNSAPYDNLVLAGGTIVGGTLITGPDGALNTGSTSGYYESTLDGVTVEGGLLLGSGPEDFGALALIDGTRILAADGVSPGTITVDGTTLELRGYTTLANDITLTGYGDLRFTQTAPNNSFSPVSSPLPTIEVAAGVLVDGGGTIGDGGGGYGSQGQYTLVNDGTIDADISGDTLTIETENFTNDGTVAAQYGGNLNIVPEISYSSSGEVVGTFTNLSGDTLTGDTLSGGTYSVDAQSTLYIEYAGAVVFDDATITLSGDNYTGYYGNNGYSPHFFSESPSPYGTTLTPLENTLLTVSPDGALNLVDGYSFVSTNTSGYSFSIAGSVTLGGGLFSVNGLNTGASGTLSGFGSVTAGEFSIGNSGLIEANGGTLELLSPTFAGFAGAGSLAIGSTGAVLDLTGADDENVLFNGLVGELEIARPTSFSGAITGVAPGDMIAITSPGAELTDPHLSPGSTSTSGTLEVSDGQNTYSFAISGDLGTGNFIVTGTDTIVLSPSVTATEPAQGRLNSPTTINLGHVHVGESGDQFLSLTNIASPGAQGLDVSIGSVTGGVTASGGIVDLEPDHTSDNAIAIGLGGGTAGTEDDTVTLVLSSDPGDGSPPTVLTTIPVTVEGVVDNRAAVSLTRLPSANSPPGDFTQTGPYAYEYKVDLAADSPPPEIDFGLTNTALAPGDSLFGNFSIVEDAAATAGDTFINHFVNFGEPGLAPGAADDSLSLTINTQNTGAYSETITFDPTAYDPDYQGSLPPVTLTIDVFLPPSPLTQSDAEATVSPNPVLFSPLHELKGGEYPSAPQTAQVSPLTIGNTADPGSAKLTGSVTNSTGPAQGIGAVGPLDPGGTDTGGIKVQVPNAALQDAGGTTFNGAVTVGFQSNYDFGTVSPLPSQTVNYSGAIYAYADPELASPYGSSTLQSSAIADLGQFTPSDAPVDVDFDIYNDAPYPYADYLTGTWDFNSPPGFSPIFLSPVTSPLAGDGAAPDVAEIEFDPSGLSPGTYTAVLTFEPYNQSPINGFSGALPDVTLELEAQIGPTPSPPPKPPTPPTPPQPPAPPGPPPIPSPPPPPPPGPVAPPPPTGHTGGDVHLTTFAGGYYTLQAAGEFVLAQSTVAGDSFEIEGRFEPPAGNSFVTYTTAIAAEIGSDDVTFDAFRSDTVWINHSPVALGGPNSVMTLSGGTLTELSPTIFELAWNTGETLTVDIVPNSEIETSLSLPLDALPGSVKGLLGGFDGRANDFALPNGTVLTQPLSPSTLYSQFANAWRVSPSTTLFDYSAGEDTKDFTNLDFPLLNIPLSDFPTALVQRALEMATAAGITDPNLIDAAAYDYLVSGSPAAFTAIAELGIGSPTVASPFSRTAATATLIGVFAAATSVREAGSGATTVTFEVYLAQQASQAITVDYAVVDTAPGDLSATALGGTLPSGTVTIAQGSKTATFSVTVPEGALGGMPSGTLAIQIASDPSNSNAVVIGANAQTQIVSGTPVAGPPAIAEFGIVSGQYTLAQSGNNYTLNFGTLVAGELVSFHLAIENLAAALADDLTGAISATGTGFALANTKLPSPIAPGASYQSLVITPDTSANGNFTETITFAARDVNDTGFAANLSPLVLTITDAVAGQAAGRVNTASPIAFGNVHLGTTVTQAISVTNTASPPAAGLDATAAGSGDASTAGRVSGLAPGATDATDLVVQLGTNAAGPQSGAVTVDFSSDSGDGNVTSLPASPAIAVTATVYREAVAAVSPISDAIVHVHGSGDIALAVGNATASDGYSEDLLASVIGVAGAVAAGGTTGDIAPGGSSNAIEVSVATDTAGLVTGTVTLGLASDGGTGAGSIDGLGTTALSPRTVGVSVVVNNYADPLFESPADAGTLTRNGNDFTLDLGEIARGSGPLTIDFGVLNAVTGPADLLSGGFTASGAAEFTTAGLAAFSGVAAGQADAAPSVTLDTGAAGTYSETITLTATGSNASGYSGALSPETLTITGQVAELPPPVITVPTAISAFTDVTLTLAPVSIADSDADGEPLTVVVSDGGGTLTAAPAGDVSITGENSHELTLTGDLADLNTTLASLSYLTSQATGSDTISLSVTDVHHATASEQIAVNTLPVPFTAPVLVSPVQELYIPGTATGVGGLKVVDPFAEATNSPVSVSFQGASPDTQLTVTGNSGATITGEGTSKVTITGTVQEVNADLADGLIEFVIGTLGNFDSSGISGIISATDPEGLVSAAGGPEGKFFQIGVAAASYAIEGLLSLIPGNPPVSAAAFYAELAKILAGFPHVVTLDGLAYDLEGAGEYFLTGSTESSDSFTVEVRLQPYGNSQSVSVMTAVAALLGTDRVTFQINRPNTVWVDGAAENISVGETISLTGGQLTEISSGTYQIAWNTGEMLGVTDHGSYLDVGVGLGSGDAPGTLAELMGPDNGQANDFTLPDGTVLAQPLTAAALAEFTNAWRVTQATSLFDYSPGQSTATFTDVGFPEDAVKLADLPADVVAKAAVVVAAAGITDPVAVADAEFDYIASGGDVNVVTADAAEFQGVASTAAAVSPPVGPAVAVLGVIADEPQVITPANGPTEVTFDVYLTAAEATGTVVDYSVIAPDAGDLAGAAFGGSPPTGEITILAGDTTGQFTVAVPEGALGTNPNQTLEVAISAPGGTPIFVSTAQATVVQPLPGPVPLPQLSDLTTLGTFAGSGSRYSLDLGAIQAGEPLPVLQFMISNAAGTGADDLAGSFSVDPVEGFTVAGASPLSPLAPGQSYRGLEVSVDEMKFGANSETITFTPEDVNASGYSAALSPPITLDVSYTLEQQTMVYSQAWGDVHIVTYNGLSYNFQAVGEFTLAKSRLPGDSFDIEMRLQPYYSGASVSVITAVAVSVGSDRVTFSMGRADTVWIDGTPSTIDVANPTVSLDGGLLQEVSPSVWQVSWNTGETATITKVGDSLFNIVDGVPVSEPGFVGGLQGEDEGSTNDFQLADGTVLPQPLSPATLYGEYANSWRVSPATTLFDYGPGQSTTTYTDVNFPTDLVNLSELPATAVAAAAALVAAAGITDPGIAAQAEYDYLATGNVDFITAAADANAQGTTTTPVVMVSPPPPPPTLGIAAEKVSIVETPDGATAVTFDIYLTGAETSATTVAYTVIDGGAGYLGAAELGGPLPSGTATIAAGATSTTVTIDVPDGALGNQPNADLELQISSPAGGPSVFAPNATTEIIHSPPVAGTPPAPALVELAGGGIFSFDAATSTYTIDLGTIPEGAVAPLIQLGIANNAAVPADELSGNFTVPLGSGFLVTGADLPHAIAAAQMYGGLYLSANTATPGSYTETFSFDPKDVNDSGYIAALPGDDFTIVVTDTVGAAAQATLNTPDMILFPNVRRGTPESETISVSNSTPTGSADLDVTPAAGGDTYANGSVALLAAGATDATSISIGLDTASIGPLSGTVTLALQSDSGGGVTEPILPSPTIQVFGSVFDEASALIAPVSEIVHVHDADTAALGVANADTIKYFSENLIASLAGTTGGISIVSGGPTGEIAEGSADDTSLTIGFSTATAGVDSGNVTVALISDGGTGAGSIDGLGQIALPSQVVPISVTVDNYAAAGLSETNGVGTFTAAGTNGEGGANYTLDLGTVALGASPVVIDLDALNTAAGQADLLAGLFSETGDGAFVNALGPFSGLGAGDATEAGTVTLDTDGAGTFSETITLIGTGSNASGYSGTVSPATLTIEGTVAASPPPPPPPPPPASPPPSITAPVSVTVQAGEASAVAGIAIADAAIGTGGVTVTLSDGHGALAASGAGGATIGGSGGIALTISGTLSEVNAALATLTDTDANSTPDTITIGVSDADGSAGPATTLVGHVFTLTKSADTVAGGPGNDLILAAAGTPSAGDAIDGGGGSDTLELVGAGVFNLATPTTIVNIQNIVLQEGQAAYAINGNTYVAQNQIVNLRSGLNDVTVTVLADTTYNPANPNVAVITVVANSNNDTIDLPSGEDPAVATSIATLTVGSAQQTVNLGGGNNVIMVNAATINATIGNGTGSDKLQVTGGGTMAMGSNISDIATVQLSAASSPYDFTANGIAGLTITDASTTLDTVQAGGADQAITGGGAGKLTMLGAAAGGDTFKNTAALFNNDTIGGFAAPGDIIDLTDLVYGAGAIRSFAENSAGTSAMLVVSDGSHTADLTLLGQFANAFVAAPDAAGTGTQITYQPTQEELALLAHH